MIPLIKICDDFTSNKYVSVGATVASIGFMAYKVTLGIPGSCFHKQFLTTGICAGGAFALLAKTYLINKIEAEAKKNSAYATMSLFTATYGLQSSIVYSLVFQHNMIKLTRYFGVEPCLHSLKFGIELGFLATNLALQLMEKPTANKA